MNAVSGGSSLPLHYSPSQASLADIFFPGFNFIFTSAQQLLAGNVKGFTRLLFGLGIFILFVRYIFSYIREVVRNYFASTIHISCYDEIYDMLIDWIAHDQARKKPLTFSPWDGTFLSWYRGHLLTFHRVVREHGEDIYLWSIGQSPSILKELIGEYWREYLNINQRKVPVGHTLTTAHGVYIDRSGWFAI